MLKIQQNLSFEEQRLTVQTALLEGFFSESACFPVASRTKGEEIPKTLAEFTERYEKRLKKENQPPQDYKAATSYAKAVPDFDWRVQKGLEKLFERGPYLSDNDGDFLPDHLNLQFSLPEKPSDATMIAACNFAYRLGMEVTAIDGWLLTREKGEKYLLRFEETGTPQITLQENHDILFSGKGTELVDFSTNLCEKFPKLSHFENWSDYLKELSDSFLLKNVDGQLTYLATLADGQPATAYVSPDFQLENKIVEEFPQVEFKKYTDKKKVYQKEYKIPWEVDSFKEKLAPLYPQLRQGDHLYLQAVLSEDPELRSQLKKEIEHQLAELGVSSQIEIISAHKQGYSWLAEYVLPQLKEDGVSKLKIAFKPFLAHPEDPWTEEDGATPSYTNLDQGKPEQWLDLPIRYLQELYPIQDLLIKELSLTEDQIEFVKYEGEEALTYQVTAENEAGHEIYQNTYQACYSERPYLDAFPGMGKVHPATGHLLAEINGKNVIDQNLATDLEKIWDIYQGQVLPDCNAFIEQKGHPTKEQQPFFSQLKLEIEASEPDYPLASRNDLFSSLDALHEDLYFVGLDYFKNYGMQTTGEVFDCPGLILPVIKKAAGAPVFRVTLYEQMQPAPKIIAAHQLLEHPERRADLALAIQKMTYVEDKIQVTIAAHGVAGKVLAAYCHLLEQNQLAQKYEFSQISKIIFDDGHKTYQAKITAAEKQKRIGDIEKFSLKEDEFIGYDRYLTLIEELKGVPGIAVYQTATSYLGRKIYAIEFLPPKEGYVSRTKRLTNHPSEIINSRHHANENSSTNSAFMLVKRLLTDGKYKDLAQDLNLVIVPLENVDGAAIHDELQKENPYWKLHTARFNGIGDEFYYEHFQEDPRSPEALGLTRLYERFVPDVIVDNHGVPTHEWEQPFSGYTSPSYKGFWLPRSLLYGYFWIASNQQYKANVDLNKAIEKTIAYTIEQDDEIHRWNVAWARQFETYAHAWLPKLFPAEYYQDMINYWIEFAEDAHHRYPSIRFPWLTSVSYTSEVADETAQGDYLALCARAHRIHDLAIIDLLREVDCFYQDERNISDLSMSLQHRRQRPIFAKKIEWSEGNGMA